MIVLSKKDIDLGFLTSEFKGLKVELFSSDALSFINCIVCWFRTSQDLMGQWEDIQSIISLGFKPEARFSKWNIYLVLLSETPVDIRDKYVIENDRYAARKIVIDGVHRELTTEEVEAKLNIELLGADLELRKNAPSSTSTLKLAIAPIIKNVPVDSTSSSKDKRGEVVNKLIEYYKQNENKQG
ncbi:ABC-three component system middle component 1 [Pseudomonas poae]|uniref:ABC-three component system middle component 1 n=1 Tax=Pseudomonas poae TaxID=200451 RepID=UPI0034D506AD